MALTRGSHAEQQEHAVSRSAKIYGLLYQAAERGEECPENNLLAERFGCSRALIVNALHFLESCGMIHVQRGGFPRVVTIFATGKKTRGKIRPPNDRRKNK